MNQGQEQRQETVTVPERVNGADRGLDNPLEMNDEVAGKGALISNLKKYALKQLRILEGYEIAKREFTAASKAYQALTGESIGEKKVGGVGRPPGKPGPQQGYVTAHQKGSLTDRILVALVGKNIRPSELSEQNPNLAHKTTIFTQLQRMFKLGLVDRKIDSASGSRVSYYKLTKAGEERANQFKTNPTILDQSPAPSSRRTKKEGRIPLSSMIALTTLLKLGGKGRPIEISEALGLSERRDRDRVAVMLPFLRSKGDVKSNKDPEGHVTYRITARGKARVAASINQ